MAQCGPGERGGGSGPHPSSSSAQTPGTCSQPRCLPFIPGKGETCADTTALSPHILKPLPLLRERPPRAARRVPAGSLEHKNAISPLPQSPEPVGIPLGDKGHTPGPGVSWEGRPAQTHGVLGKEGENWGRWGRASSSRAGQRHCSPPHQCPNPWSRRTVMHDASPPTTPPAHPRKEGSGEWPARSICSGTA